MKVQSSIENDLHLSILQRACRHHDHLKSLVQEYQFMREQQTYARLADPNFRTDPALMTQSDSRTWLRDATGGSVYLRLSTRPLEQPLREMTPELERDIEAFIAKEGME